MLSANKLKYLFQKLILKIKRFLGLLDEYKYRDSKIKIKDLYKKSRSKNYVDSNLNDNVIVCDKFFISNIAKIHSIKNKLIDIIIPVYNGFDYLEQLFASIIKNTDLPYNLIVVDDKSSDERVLVLLKQYKDKIGSKMQLHCNKENLGFVKTVNFAINNSKNDLVILNTDVVVPKDWASRLLYPIFNNNKVASVTPFSNAATIFSFPLQWIDNDIKYNVNDVDKIFKKVFCKDKDFYLDFPTGVGFCMAISKKAIKKIGLLDETFGKGYGEENDWCMKAKKAGMINTVAYNLFVYHKHGGSFHSEEKRKLIFNNSKIINERYPDYNKQVQDSGADKNYYQLRFLLLILYYNNFAEKTILFFDHSLGGGTDVYFEHKLKNLLSKNNFVIRFQYLHKFHNIDQNKYQLTIFFQESKFLIFSDNYNNLIDILEKVEIQEVVLNNLVGYLNSLDMLKIISKLKKNSFLSVRIHDYQAICPFFNLLSYEGVFCNIPNIKYCKTCFLHNKIDRNAEVNKILISGASDIEEWREYWHNFLQNYADEIVVFDNSGKDILLKSYPNIEKKIIITPHEITQPLRKINTISSSTINIGIIGNIQSVHKGTEILREIENIINHNKFSLCIIGEYNAHSTRTKVLGKYNIQDLPDILEKNNINIVFIPSIWPETFNYTSSEAIEMNIPVACFNIGAQGAKILKYKKGLILHQMNAEYILEQIKLFFQSSNIQ